MAQTNVSALSNDQKKYIAAKLISRSYIRLVCKSVCEMEKLPKGNGLTAYFIRYERINVPTTVLTEGQTDPTPQAATMTTTNCVMDQWGDIVEATDLGLLSASHNVEDQIAELLSEAASKLVDREVQIVWLAGTNVIYGDGTVTTRATVGATMYLSEDLLLKARVQMTHQGAPVREGPSGGNMVKVMGADTAKSQMSAPGHYLCILPPQVTADIQRTSASFGTWASVATYNGSGKDVYNGEIGMLNGIRFVESNFLPIFRLLGTSAAGVATGGTNGPVTVANVATGGTLTSAVTYFWKVTRKSLLRGFEEDISIAHSTSSGGAGDNESMSFTFASTAGYVYNLYFDTVQAGGTGTDATLGLVQANIAAGAVVTVLAVAAATTNPPPSTVAAAGTAPAGIYVCYLHGAESCKWVGFQDLRFMQTADEPIIGNALLLRRQWSYKFSAKSLILDQVRILRLEVAARNNPS